MNELIDRRPIRSETARQTMTNDMYRAAEAGDMFVAWQLQSRLIEDKLARDEQVNSTTARRYD